MSDPVVACIMLTRDRPEMAQRAVASFRAQSYERKGLLIYDTITSFDPVWHELWKHDRNIEHGTFPSHGRTIGELRNAAIVFAGSADIICHMDDDDWSHPNRLAEQVALLQSSGADCVGYNEALFWDTRQYCFQGCDEDESGYYRRAYLYRNPIPSYVLGTSMLYWRRTWEAHPFDAVSYGEDERFRTKCGKVVGESSLLDLPSQAIIGRGEPRMICSIHGGNTSPFDPARSPAMCRRVPDWDEYCVRAMEAWK